MFATAVPVDETALEVDEMSNLAGSGLSGVLLDSTPASRLADGRGAAAGAVKITAPPGNRPARDAQRNRNDSFIGRVISGPAQ